MNFPFLTPGKRMLRRVPRTPALRNVLSIWLGLLGACAVAAPGDLDPTFSGDGKLTTSFSTYSDRAYGVKLQNDGKILVVGYTETTLGYDFALARYNANGTVDGSFGGGFGKVTTNVGDAGRAYSVAVQNDGKIVVVGFRSDDIVLVRYNANGTLDGGFDGDGRVYTRIGSASNGYSVTIQNDGKIVAGGLSWPNGNFALARYNTNGSLDSSFGNLGKVTTDFDGRFDWGRSLVLQSDGKIVLAGHSANAGNDDFAIARYNVNGTLDSTFGGGSGKAITSIGAGDDFGYSVALQADGRIVVAGHVFNANGNYDIALVRYTSDGTLDSSFGGGDGIITTPTGSTYDVRVGVAVQNDGKILVAGDSSNGSNADFAVLRYNPDGTLDRGFGRGAGKVLTSIGTGHDYAYSVALQPDGKILVAGHSYTNGFPDFGLVRYKVDPFANYLEWATAFGVGSFTADYDGEGLSNGLEYMLGICPDDGNGTDGPASLPSVSAIDAGGVRLRLTFEITEPVPLDGRLTIEASDDLGQTDPWTTIKTKAIGTNVWSGPAAVSFHALSNGRTQVLIDDTKSLSENPHRFLRLRSSH